MSESINWSQVSAFRFKRHHLPSNQLENPVNISGDVCGIQPQVLSAAKLAFGARLADNTHHAIEAALWDSRKLVKTSCLRQTLHIIPSVNFSIYINALKNSQHSALNRIMSRFNITQKEREDLNNHIINTLSNGPLTKQKLANTVKKKVSKNVKMGMEKVWNPFKSVMADGLVCYYPIQGQKTTLVLTGDWLPEYEDIPAQEAKRKLLMQYLRAYGPAVPQDFSKWSGIAMSEVAEIWRQIKHKLSKMNIGTDQKYILTEDYDVLKNTSKIEDNVRLIPGFDPYLLGHRTKNHLVDSQFYKKVFRNQGWISPVILLNGKIYGVWSYNKKGKNFEIDLNLFEKPTADIKSKIEKEAERMGKFMDYPFNIKWTN